MSAALVAGFIFITEGIALIIGALVLFWAMANAMAPNRDLWIPAIPVVLAVAHFVMAGWLFLS